MNSDEECRRWRELAEELQAANDNLIIVNHMGIGDSYNGIALVREAEAVQAIINFLGEVHED